VSRPWQIALGIALATSLAVDLVLPGKDVKHVWEHETFFAWFGLLGCIAIILVSKALGKRLLQRPASYYEELRRDAEADRAAGAQAGPEDPHAG